MTAEPTASVCVLTLDAARKERLPDLLVDDGQWLGNATAVRAFVLPEQSESRAGALLEMGAARVYVGDAAVADSEAVTRLLQTYGPEQIGVYIRCRRMEVSWSLETESNADFSVVTPSVCEPAWEILRADGSRTGTLASWWLGVMFERGVGSALLQVDIADDTDLNLCATLTEAHGDKLWLAPLAAGNRLGEWVRWGKAAQLAVPFATFDADADLQAIRASPPVAAALEAA